ncbi:MAG: 50S ribosomal protein L4 [Candidatus Paceibacterota bacterium]|nr:MAG: 50S ribosomal protein L4 [Candidatus Paceibacterota bacterium]
MEAKIYNKEGKEAGKIQLPEEVFGVAWNDDLIHKVAVSMASNKRAGTAHTKNRGEVSGGGKKPWRQKGTGRARHGSIRSPIWVGGGVAHGPRSDKSFEKKINKKEKNKALRVVLSRKLADGEILFIESFDFSGPKTSEAKKALSSLSAVSGFENLVSKKKNSAVIALADKNKNLEKSFRNFGNMEVEEIKNINPLLLLEHKYLIIANPEESLKKIPGKI